MSAEAQGCSALAKLCEPVLPPKEQPDNGLPTGDVVDDVLRPSRCSQHAPVAKHDKLRLLIEESIRSYAGPPYYHKYFVSCALCFCLSQQPGVHVPNAAHFFTGGTA